MIKKLLIVCVVALVLFTSVSAVSAVSGGITVEDWIVHEYEITLNSATSFIDSHLPSFNNEHQDTTFNPVDLPVVRDIHKIVKDIDKDGESAK